MSALVVRTLRSLSRRKSDQVALTPENAGRWLRAYWAEGRRKDAFGAGDAKLWRERLQTRRSVRGWEKELLALPAFRRVMLALEGAEIVETFTTLGTLASRLGFMQSRLNLQRRDPIHPLEWGDNLLTLRHDAESLRAVAASQPLLAATLNQAADSLESAASASPKNQWFPFDRDNIATRGPAAQDVDSAMRGWFVVELSKLMPEGVEKPYATIADLLQHAGMDIAPDRVRTILTNRERFRA